jgi:hypothetical protein
MSVLMQRLGRLLPLYACIVCLSAGIAWGQAENSAAVTGTVTDQSGAMIPGVTVTAINLDKNTERVVTTNQAGLYDTGPLAPGDRYELVFKKEGFSSLRRGPMTLRVGTVGMNAELTVGQTTSEVLVRADAPILETTSSEKSETLPSETLAQLPQVGNPDWQQFIILLPGTSGTGNTNTVNMDQVSANGSMPFSTALFDGANSNSPMSNNVITTPIFDTISEVKVTTSLFSAQYGNGGALFNQISKGGTNKFHGMGYDYFRNTALNANAYQFGTKGVRTPIHYNALGGNVGGPIIKDKIFFFYGMERVINHGAANVTYISVPTDNLRDANFTGMSTIYDPTTQTVDSTTGIVTRQPFAGNKIAPNMLDPVAKNIQTIFPKSNLPGTVANGVTTNNYQYALPSKAPRIKYFGRFDADIIRNHRITGSATWNDNWTHGVGPVAPVNVTDSDIMNSNAQLSDYWTVSPTTLNEFRWGFMAEYDKIKPQTMNQGWPQKMGLQYSKADIFPGINITNMYALAGGNPSHANYQENQHDISDVVTLIRGRHSLKIGGNMIYMIADSTAWGNINGATLGFTGVYTAGSNSGPLASTSGVPYADFLLGYAKSWTAAVSPQYAGRLRNPAVFIQDDFKVSRKLTLNLGLRWMGTTGLWDRDGNSRSFDPTVMNPASGKLGAMWYGITAANGRKALQKSQYNNWLPRLGFAYLFDDKTTVRGGFGMYTFPWNVDIYGSNGLGNAFTSSGNLTDSTNNVQPVVILGSDGNTNYQGSKGASINSIYKKAPTAPEAYNGQSVGFQQYDSPVPRLYSWNFTIQRQLTQSLMTEIGYVGSYQNNLPFLTDLNQPAEDKLGPNSAQYRPYPFQTISGNSTQGKSNYNSLQMSFTQRMRGGLTFNFNYTWSHMLSNQDSSGRGTMMGTQAYQRAYNPDVNYGASNFDVRHAFKGHVVYAIPFGRGHRFLNQNAVADRVIGGWTLSGTLVSQAGSPFTPVMATNNSYSLSSNNSWYPNVVGNPALSNPTINGWFNVNAFAAPTAGTFGNMGRNILYGPGIFNIGMSLSKSFTIREGLTFDLNGNATNVLNHPSFAQPDRLIGAGHIGNITGVRVGARNIELVFKLRF